MLLDMSNNIHSRLTTQCRGLTFIGLNVQALRQAPDLDVFELIAPNVELAASLLAMTSRLCVYLHSVRLMLDLEMTGC
jgi:hypothetical protein